MSGSTIVDVVLVLVLLGALSYGFSRGFFRTVGGLIGIVAGGIAAYFVIPQVAGWIPEPGWRVAGVIGATLLLLATGHAIGSGIGRLIRRGVNRVKLGGLDRVVGAVVNVVVTALVATLVASGISTLGIPGLSPALASSTVLRTIDSFTPDPAKVFLAQVRSAALGEGATWLVEALGAPTIAPELPDFATSSPELVTAAQSVVRITGTAYQCGENLSGSGFVVSTDRVVTNAHVVAGVTEPVVEVPGKVPAVGRVVYFDPAADLAVIAVDGLQAAPIPLADTLAVGSGAAVAGYPFGGPFSMGPAEVLTAGPLLLGIGSDARTRDVYTLAAAINQGNSGGPVLDLDGKVAGVVFAKASSVANVGYAVTMTDLLPVADQAPGLTTAVGSGSCSSH
jgi:S1-C subfamily serine protease